jgi:hypothetical protein
MEFLIQLCVVLSVLRPLIFAIEFVDECNHLGGPIFAEKDGWARIGCKTDSHFGYCTLTRISPHLTCKIEITNRYKPEIIECPEKARIRFTGSATEYYCEFLIQNVQSEGSTIRKIIEH